MCAGLVSCGLTQSDLTTMAVPISTEAFVIECALKQISIEYQNAILKVDIDDGVTVNDLYRGFKHAKDLNQRILYMYRVKAAILTSNNWANYTLTVNTWKTIFDDAITCLKLTGQ